MARISTSNDTSTWKINKFLGLNENPDGDTALKIGEFSEMRNFCITKDSHLQVRPGTMTVARLFEHWGETPLPRSETQPTGFWRGTVGHTECILAAWGGGVFSIDPKTMEVRRVGTMTAAETTFFGFGGKVYALNGHEYMVWDGGTDTQFTEVRGYVPLVLTAASPDGEGTLLEEVNRLTGYRRAQFSPDGKASEFRLPETGIDEVTSVRLNGRLLTEQYEDDEGNTYGDYYYSTDGQVIMTSVPPAGTNTLEITWRKGNGSRQDVSGMRFAELFNGENDTRVFLYGDGTNKTIYSGVEYDSGQPSAEYFPDLYEAAIGESNTPITALVRHYNRLMAFKPGSAWMVQYGNLTLSDSRTTAAFYVQPINRQFGNDAMGQVNLLENDPLTLDVGSVYQWKSSSLGYISTGESNAKRISDRVTETLASFRAKDVLTFNLKSRREYWFLYEGQALILNYGNDCWYYYNNLPFVRMVEADTEIFGLCRDGRIVRMSRDYRSDDGEELDCYAATGSMDFDRDWLRKYSPMIFVAIQPESGARIHVTAMSDRRSDYPEKTIAYSFASFSHVDFNHFSFSTNRKPKVKRLKLKVKKATFYKLIFKLKSKTATATVIETDVQLRYAGAVK